MLHKPHLPGNLISKTKGKDTITDKDKEKDKDKDTEKFIGINTKTKAQNHEFRNIMNVCAGMLLEERNVCLCLVFVSLSPAASHQESCYSQDLVLSPAVPFAHLGNLIRYKVPDVVKYGAMQVGSHGKVEKYLVPIEVQSALAKKARVL